MLKRGILIIMLLVGAVLGCLSQNGVSSPANYGYLESTGLKLDRRILNNFDERGKKTGLWIDTLQLGALRITNYFAGSRMGLSTTYHPTSLKNAYFPLLQVEYNLDRPEMVAVWYDNRNVNLLVTKLRRTEGECESDSMFLGRGYIFDRSGYLSAAGDMLISMEHPTLMFWQTGEWQYYDHEGKCEETIKQREPFKPECYPGQTSLIN